HDIPFERPAARLRDVVTKVRALLDGLPVRLHDVPAARPLSLGQPPVPGLPIWIAALGQHTTNVAAELGDGWIPALVARDHVAAWAARLGRRRETAAPNAPAPTVAAGPIAARRLTGERQPRVATAQNQAPAAFRRFLHTISTPSPQEYPGWV